jgi:hypothetical protein
MPKNGVGSGETLLYKDDWPLAQERINAWWAREPVGRVAMAVRAPKNNAPKHLKPEKITDPAEKWSKD